MSQLLQDYKSIKIGLSVAFCLIVRRSEIQSVLIFFNVRVFLIFGSGADTYECYGEILSKNSSVIQYLMKANKPSQLKARA